MNSLRQIRILMLFPVLFGIAAPTTAQELESSEDLAARHRAEVAERYAAEEWTVGARRVGLARDLELSGLVEIEQQTRQGQVRRVLRRAEREAPALIQYTQVFEQPAGAHGALLTWLAGLQSPARMPSLSELGEPMGDVGFFGRSGAAEGAQAWVAFVRGNVMVRLNAFDATRDPGLDLVSAARSIDLNLLEAPLVPEGLPIPRPVIEALALQSKERPLVAGDRRRISVAVGESDQVSFTWSLGGDGLGYVEMGRDGTWWLHTTGPGRIVLQLEVTGPRGTTSTSTIETLVQDD